MRWSRVRGGFASPPRRLARRQRPGNRCSVAMMGEDTHTIHSFKGAAVIARSVGIVAIALGFVGGMYGLDHPESAWLRTSLGLIVTGLLAQGYALICTARRFWQDEPPDRS